ncbi:unnamed protein product [Coffea canephora]|uniref:Histidine kinase/HSP90-like ATPase domain-containing protein n=1 Tax=Coffea canephora TaxID=49390 RepID=A0A068UVY0_COFCA|nr:unnamed protein product [Coffea canephora]
MGLYLSVAWFVKFGDCIWLSKSLYNHKDVFLQEFVSNASDALDKLRFLSMIEFGLLRDASDLEIHNKPDPNNGAITIRESGIGMTKNELTDYLETIV